MKSLHTVKKTPIPLDMQRDDCPVIARTGGSAAAIKKQFAKLNRVLQGIPRARRGTSSTGRQRIKF